MFTRPNHKARREAEKAANLAALLQPSRTLHKPVMARIDGCAQAVAKDGAIEHEGYRRLVAAMPCKACKIDGYSQAAHVPPDGKGIKQDDRLTFPLCCTRPGVTGCHVDFDQYRMFPSDKAREIGRQWAAETRAEIAAAGKWPQNLDRWSDA